MRYGAPGGVGWGGRKKKASMGGKKMEEKIWGNGGEGCCTHTIKEPRIFWQNKGEKRKISSRIMKGLGKGLHEKKGLLTRELWVSVGFFVKTTGIERCRKAH